LAGAPALGRVLYDLKAVKDKKRLRDKEAEEPSPKGFFIFPFS
jgi:hypothetical protein